MYTCTTTLKRSFFIWVPQPCFQEKRVIFTLNSTLPGSYFQTKFCLGDYYGAQNHATFLVIGIFSPQKWQILIGHISKTSGHAYVTLFTSSFMNMHGPCLVHSLRVNINKDYYARGGGGSHFGGAAYVGLLRPLFFSTTVTQWPHIFFKSMALAQRHLIFSFDLSPKASNFSISTANWLFQVILCTIIPF